MEHFERRAQFMQQAAIAAFPGELERFRGQETTADACRRKAARAALDDAKALWEEMVEADRRALEEKLGLPPPELVPAVRGRGNHGK